MCIALETIEKLEKEIQSVLPARECLREQMKYYDNKLSELYHSIENQPKLNASNGYKVYSELYNLLKERRKIKKELAPIDSLMSQFFKTKKHVSTIWDNNNKDTYDYFSVQEILAGEYEILDAMIPNYEESLDVN